MSGKTALTDYALEWLIGRHPSVGVRERHDIAESGFLAVRQCIGCREERPTVQVETIRGRTPSP